MVFVARDQQKRVYVAIREHSRPGDLSTIVDKGPIAQCQTRTARCEGIQVRHEAVLPKKPVHIGTVGTGSTWIGKAHDLTFGVDVKRETAVITVTVEGS